MPDSPTALPRTPKLIGVAADHGGFELKEYLAGNRPSPRRQEDDPTAQIAKRAYEPYERRGRQSGQTVQDWLHAEREIRMEAKP
jgi:hypothetical protein